MQLNYFPTIQKIRSDLVWYAGSSEYVLREFQHGASRRAPFARPKKTPTQQAGECFCRISSRPSIGLFFS